MIPEIDGTQFTPAELAAHIQDQRLPVIIKAGAMSVSVGPDNANSIVIALVLASKILQDRKERNA